MCAHAFVNVEARGYLRVFSSIAYYWDLNCFSEIDWLESPRDSPVSVF